MAEVALLCHRSEGRAQVRELTGADEQAVHSPATIEAVRLIGAMLTVDGSHRALDPMTLAAADRDRILAAIYLETFGARIESTVDCAHCGNLFDLYFRLDDLALMLERNQAAKAKESSRGVFEASSGFHFRLPTAGEEMEAARMPAGPALEWLAAQCIFDSDPAPGLDELEQAMEEAAPAMDLELAAYCAECGAMQPVRFDIQSYLLNAILEGRTRLYHDVHRIATAYHWSREEILAMPRTERRELADLIEGETMTRRRVGP